ncbi:MAG: hypothetical protein IJ204_01040 [Paludibacteraceae bacterium]|nr:hypothetical protein [Paludibacteraceae bacterium]
MRKKMILALMLAIVSSVWMTKAACLMQAPEAMYQPFETVSGTLTSIGFPCEGEEPCPTCLTIALVTDAKTYYLSTSDAQMQAQLDELEMQLPLRATISGTPFVNGSFDLIKVQSVSVDNSLLPSLCDEWNIAKISNAGGPIETIHTVKAVLGSDTIIESQNYVKLIEDGEYKGSLREGESGFIYYIPAGSAHEYLLYNFNAQVGDKLTNLWYGGDPERCPNGYNATVLSISDETPRVFTIEVEYIISDSDGDHITPWLIYWTEGVGLSDGPAGQFCLGPDCECSCGQVLLCAYKNGEQVYVSELGEQYSCEYNYDPYATPTDTIPLFSYTGDDPGSSTVDPVDPNQVVVTLNGDQLTIREFSNVDVTYTLRHNAPAKMPTHSQTSASDTFRNEITLQITESGEYQLLLTNPSWDYSIYGTFFYSPQGVENVHSTSVPQKVLQNGQFYILRNGKVYTITGQRVR